MQQFNIDPDMDQIHDNESEKEFTESADSKLFDEEDQDELGPVVLMEDEETGEEFEFIIADTFDYDGKLYSVLLSTDEGDEEEAAIFVRMEEGEDGEENFVSLEDDEFDEVYEAYSKIIEEDLENEEFDFENDDSDYEDNEEFDD